MNCSRLSFVSVYTRNISSIYLFQCVGEGFVSERILDSSVPMKMLENSFSTKTFSDLMAYTNALISPQNFQELKSRSWTCAYTKGRDLPRKAFWISKPISSPLTPNNIYMPHGNLIPLMLLSMICCLYPLFFIFLTCFSLYIWNVASFEFIRR